MAGVLRSCEPQKTQGSSRFSKLYMEFLSSLPVRFTDYAKAQGRITDAVSYKEWCDDYFEMEGELQKQWEQE